MTVTKNRFLVESCKGTTQDLSKTRYVYKDAGVCVAADRMMCVSPLYSHKI